MNMKVKIIGAGSIGNHLAQASRRMGWEVSVVDADPKALERMKNDIYPKRYGAWDDSIKLFTPDKEPKGGFDIIMLGTPPDVRMKLALEALKENPKLLHLEKPLCAPDLKGVDEFRAELRKHPETIVVVGYDNAVGQALEEFAKMLRDKVVGNILTLDVEFREHWRGIFGAHPWLAGPWETYLGYWKRGGGAGGEHSHALHLWRHLAEAAGWDKISDVKSSLAFKKEREAEYDYLTTFLLKTESGKVGRVVQDVITFPVKKWARAQGEKGFIEWVGNASPEGDLLRYQVEGGELIEKIVSKKRPDDFYCETLHYQKLLSGEIKLKDSPLSFERGLEIMKILNKAYGF
ncbi:hypothetical protein A2757_01440 [Candidatus Giovannonibacteria bacterium RIFCSPHIGHO2_01_FULL_48_47]|nr:MAG: hypothetical protein A2757_01440 [Candidatus Giovannonibacteria bacterium RIFCSPHIGHO2_01_FULL_48_47]OGF68391.1 MAG: hypothetical protein A3D61_00730 [Candidatus Giovannonibacteria bacterium RIFCSPHIGHO2_02_FULL_48_15]OGF89693.1 MAG: hypothetical protein A3B26_01565 [Candidatus Giovannonibacteria bacterium RIFCSPLOWO2_01_FULL_48_47]OGF96154.1 MAG: hypothetical protein A2613_01125 [Candidatus Giovannonibacteria bacterium RIFOXYD1_FULL_48_21]HBT81320.1 dehydrogenase [Candidatus Giovannoni